MELLLTRNWTKPNYTIGRLHVDGRLICNTLELPAGSGRGLPRCGERIAAGRYELALRYSPSNRRNCLWLIDPKDPTFEKRYILIHAGNSVKDTAGCILVGWNDRIGWLSNSRITLERLEAIVLPVLRKEKIYIKITS